MQWLLEGKLSGLGKLVMYYAVLRSPCRALSLRSAAGQGAEHSLTNTCVPMIPNDPKNRNYDLHRSFPCAFSTYFLVVFHFPFVFSISFLSILIVFILTTFLLIFLLLLHVRINLLLFLFPIGRTFLFFILQFLNQNSFSKFCRSQPFRQCLTAFLRTFSSFFSAFFLFLMSP